MSEFSKAEQYANCLYLIINELKNKGKTFITVKELEKKRDNFLRIYDEKYN